MFSEAMLKGYNDGKDWKKFKVDYHYPHIEKRPGSPGAIGSAWCQWLVGLAQDGNGKRFPDSVDQVQMTGV